MTNNFRDIFVLFFLDENSLFVCFSKNVCDDSPKGLFAQIKKKKVNASNDRFKI